MRTDKQTVLTLAREFKNGWRSRLWPFVTDKRMLVDSAVMDHIRMADIVDADNPIKPSEIMEFRASFSAKLKTMGYDEDRE